MSELGIELRAAGQKLVVRPQALDVRSFGIGHQSHGFLIRGNLLGLLGIEVFAVALVVPPYGSVIAIHHVGTWMHVTYHALRRRNRVGELMANRKARDLLGNRLILGVAMPLVA